MVIATVFVSSCDKYLTDDYESSGLGIRQDTTILNTGIHLELEEITYDDVDIFV